jgi:hypothetical protein
MMASAAAEALIRVMTLRGFIGSPETAGKMDALLMASILSIHVFRSFLLHQGRILSRGLSRRPGRRCWSADLVYL